MACPNPRIDFITQIQQARGEVHEKIIQFATSVNELEIMLLQELQELENEYRQEESVVEHLNTPQTVPKSIVLDWNNIIGQTLLDSFCKITVAQVSDPTTTKKANSNPRNLPSSDGCGIQSMRLVDKYRAITLPGSSSSSRGNKHGQLFSAQGVAIHPDSKDIYIADTRNNRIQVFNWESRCTGRIHDPNMVGLEGICISQQENRIYLTLSRRNLVQSYTLDGAFLVEIDAYKRFTFNNPVGIAIDYTERVYVCDRMNNNVVVFGSDLLFIQILTRKVPRPRDVKQSKECFNVFILSEITNSIHVYTRGGMFMKTVIEIGQIGSAHSFDTDSRGNFLITDTENDCLKIFNRKGFHICDVGAEGEGRGEFKCPTGIAVGSNDSFVTICDRKYQQLQLFVL